MLGGLISRIAEAYADPRRSAGRLLAARPSLQEGALLALAGLVVGVAFSLLAERLTGRTAAEAIQGFSGQDLGGEFNGQEFIDAETRAFQRSGDLATAVVLSLVQYMAGFAVFTGLALALGRMLGGVASAAQIAAVVGWWILATTPASLAITLTILLAGPDTRELAALALAVMQLYLFYQLAAFLAEAHRARSALSVAAAMIGAGLGAGLVAIMLASLIGLRTAAG